MLLLLLHDIMLIRLVVQKDDDEATAWKYLYISSMIIQKLRQMSLFNRRLNLTPKRCENSIPNSIWSESE